MNKSNPNPIFKTQVMSNYLDLMGWEGWAVYRTGRFENSVGEVEFLAQRMLAVRFCNYAVDFSHIFIFIITWYLTFSNDIIKSEVTALHLWHLIYFSISFSSWSFKCSSRQTCEEAPSIPRNISHGDLSWYISSKEMSQSRFQWLPSQGALQLFRGSVLHTQNSRDLSLSCGSRWSCQRPLFTQQMSLLSALFWR